jgi:hypothetical protein
MKIRKFIEFIKEELNDTPEEYISDVLVDIKRKIDMMFEDQKEGEEPKEFKPKSIKQAKEDSKENKVSFRDLGVTKESSEISKYSAMYDTYTLWLTDEKAAYCLIFMVDIKDGIPKDPNVDFSSDDIEKCSIKYKKYDLDKVEIAGPPLRKTINIKDISEEFLVDLKIELDKKLGGDTDEEFEIET